MEEYEHVLSPSFLNDLSIPSLIPDLPSPTFQTTTSLQTIIREEKRQRRKKCDIEHRFACREVGCSKGYSTHSALKKHWKEKHLLGRKIYTFKSHFPLKWSSTASISSKTSKTATSSTLSSSSTSTSTSTSTSISSSTSSSSLQLETSASIIEEMEMSGDYNEITHENDDGRIEGIGRREEQEIQLKGEDVILLLNHEIPDQIRVILNTDYNDWKNLQMFETEEVRRLKIQLEDETKKRHELEVEIERLEKAKQESERNFKSHHEKLELQVQQSISVVEALKTYVIEQERLLLIARKEVQNANELIERKESELKTMQEEIEMKSFHLSSAQSVNMKLNAELEEEKQYSEVQREELEKLRNAMEVQKSEFDDEKKKFEDKCSEYEEEKSKLISSFKQIQSLISHNVQM